MPQGGVMKVATMTFLTTLILTGALTIPVRLAAQSSSSEVTTFDAPGAGTAAGSGFGTFPTSINDGGTITGRYVDASNVNHGFLRNPGGDAVSTFDAPGAGQTAGSGQGTFPRSINKAGAITGHYIDANNVIHGFLRSSAGDKLITFDAPGAGKTAGSGQGTFPESISNMGAITGHYVDPNNVNHGFLRSAVGDKLITFDSPGASKAAGSGQGTFSDSINKAGAVTGRYIDANNVNHGFLRTP
jgi:hypothetical protein